MASLYKRGKTYWGKAQRAGITHRRSFKTGDPEVARLRLDAWSKELDQRASGVAVGSDHTVREAVDKFIAEHLPNLKPGAIRRYDTSIGWLLEHFGTRKMREITQRDLYAFEQWRRKMRHRGKQVTHVTIKRDLACFSSIYSEAECWEWVTHNPCKPYIRGRTQKGLMVEGDGRNRYLSHDEERRLIAAAPDTIRDAIVFAIDTGLRAEEQWSLTRKDINYARRRVRVGAHVAKSSRTREVPLLPRAAAIVERRRCSNVSDHLFWRGDDGERTEHTWAYRELQKAAEAAGIKDLEWHDLRRTCGCRLLQDHKMSIERVSRWLGHSGVAVTQKHYAFLRIEDLEAAIDPAAVRVG